MASTQHGKEYDFRELINRKRQHGSQPGPVKIPRNDDNNQYEVPVDPSIHNKGKRKHPAAKNTNYKSKQQKQQHSANNSFGHSNQQLERKRTSSSNTCNESKKFNAQNEEEYHYVALPGEQLRLHYQKNRQTLLADIGGSTGYHMLFRSHDCCNPDKVKICVNLMYKIACKSSEFKYEETKEIFWDYLGIFDVSCSPFWSGLSWLIRSMPCTTNPPDCFGFLLEVTSIIAVLLQMEDYLPIKVVIRFLPLDELHGSLKQLTDKDSTFNELFEQTNVLLQKRDVLRETNATIAHVSKNPAYAVLPTISELTSISEFITAGHKITSNKLYLQWHYHLLREDFINPLRNALRKIQDEEDDCKDLKIYENVRLYGNYPSFEGILHKFSFQLPGKRRTNWEHNKRLTYGSLVCLSKDGFHSIVYATVAERKTEELQKNIATLKILSVQINEFPLISPDDCYIMIESPAYLEAYAPVVSCLKAMLNNPEDLPFDDYLVKKSTSIFPPKYLQHDKTMNLSGVVCKCLDKDCTHKAVSVCNESSWCDLPSNNLDESQLKALQLALTSKLPLIQGPPGTGKTYVGVCLVKALLLNKELWNPTKNAPLLIMCYTNHALDQFLCELLQLNLSKIPKILRIGGRSKNEDIKKLNVRYHLPKHHNSRQYRWDKQNLIMAVDALNSLCNGKQYRSSHQHIYCSFLLPSEIETCPELASQIFQDDADFTVQNVLNFFEIKISSLPIASHAITTDAIYNDNDTFYHSIFEENIRRIDEYDSDLLANDDILQMAMHDDQIKHLFEKVARIEPLDHTRSNNGKMTLRKKQELFKYYLCERYKILNEQYQTQSEEIEKNEDELTLATLRTADIIGLTTTGASKYNRIIKRLHSKVLIVEEAAEVMEGQIVAALTKHTQHMILIGDHKQLRPKTNDYTIGKKYGLEISLFERLMNNKLPSVQLKYQHRMRPEISRLISPHIYEELLDHESVRNYEEIRGMKSSLFFFNHSQKESEVEDLKSPKNQFEALMIAKLANYLLKQGYTTSDITVLTPYTGQVICIKREFTSIGIRGIRIVPIDHFQGEENEIILLSLVRTVKVGFVKEENRICVALSRAKKGFYCIGNFNFLNRQSPLLERIIQSLSETNSVGDSLSLQCKTHKNITEISFPVDFSKVKEGGCSEMCGHRLKCGHICPSLCHPNEDIHNDECKKQCSIICENGHQCPLACYEQCKPCRELVLKEIPTCQHEQYVPCSINPADFPCQEDVLKKLKCGHSVMGKCGVEDKDCTQLVLKDFPCGHKAQIECYRSPQFYACRFKCQKVLGCGHVCSGTCGTCNQGRTHIPCMEPCARILFCGHKCTSKTCCADECPPCKEMCTLSCSHGPCGHKCNELCIKCAEPCEWKCPHYKCTKPCGEMCDRPRCDKSCKKKLKCGHPCLGLCDEVCPELCRTCDPENEAFQLFLGSEDEAESRFIMLQDCKHIFEVKGLDEWVCDQKDIDNQIQLKSCPKCKTVIKRSFRYANTIKSIKNDMNQIKEKITHKLNPSERQKLSKEAIELNEALNRKNRNLSDILKRSSDAILQSRHALLMAEYECNKLLPQKSQISNSPDKDRFWCQVECFIRFLQSNYCQRLPCLPTQVFHDISNERNRLLLLFEIYKLKDDFAKRNLRPPSSLFCRLASQSAFGNSQFTRAISLGQVDCRDWQYIEEVQKVINPLNGILEDDSKIKNDEFVKHLNNIREIRKRYSLDGLTDEELKTIVKAIGGKKGSWYKCPKGHLYNIGECGGATVEGRCNECNERIGGRNHRLLETNSHANIDGSQHPAWSEQANLANYEL